MSVVYKPVRVHALAAALALSLTAAPAFAGKAHVEGLRSDEAYTRFIVKYKEGSEALSSSAALNRTLTNAAGKVLPAAARNGKGRALGLKLSRDMAVKRTKLVQADRDLDNVEAAQLIRELAADPNVEWVQADLMAQAFTNDTRWADQWDMADSSVGIRGPSAWTSSTGAGVVVAVVDSGILAHADLNANVLPGYDFITSVNGGGFSCVLAGLPQNCGGSNDGDGRDADPTDSSNIRHGAHVAGTIAAVTNNNAGVAGVAPNARIVPIRALGNSGSGTTVDIADAIVWASGGAVPGVPANANPAEVINLSLGGGQACSNTPAYQDAINAAVANGAIVVVAAGNSNNDVSGFTPASCNNTVTVASSDRNGNRAWYSNYGATIDITAPGGETCSPNAEFLALGESVSGKCAQNHEANGILSTVDNNGYGYMQGTSMAAPHVAGIVALLQSAADAPLTTQQVIDTLADTARPIAAASCPGGCGPGLVDAEAAVEAVAGGGGANQAPVANFTSAANGLTVNFTDTSADADGTVVSRSWNFGDGSSSTATNPSKTYTSAGTYTVTLTVTDDDGATHSKSSAVTVTAATNNPPVADFTSAANGLTVTFTSTSTDSDGSIAAYSWLFGDGTSSTLANPTKTYAAAGTYNVTLAVSDDDQATGTKTRAITVTVPPAGPQTYTNGTDVTISDNATVTSSIAVAGRSGNAPTDARVDVDIRHTYRGDLKVELVAPDGSAYLIKDYNIWDSADNVIGYKLLNLSTEALNGTWKLRVTDNTANDTGYINSWSIKF